MNGGLHYLDETAADKLRDYRADYNNCPSNSIPFIPAVASTSGRLHCELVCIMFLQAQWENRFFTYSGVHHAQHKHDQFRLRRDAFYSKVKCKVDNIRNKTTSLCINLNIDCESTLTSMVPYALYDFTRTHSPFPLSNLSARLHFPLLMYLRYLLSHYPL